jgi:small conductance mechanosensitive channel
MFAPYALNIVGKIGLALVILAVSFFLARLLSGLVQRTLVRRHSGPGAVKLLQDLVYWSLLALGVLMALQQFVNVTAFLAGLGIVGFTVGFALQDVMKNFAAGVLLLVQQPFRVGDAVAVKEYEGTVRTIDLRSTEIVTFDGRVVILPNADVLSNAIVNYTRSTQRRVEVTVGVAYGSDLQKVRQVALSALEAVPGRVSDPAAQAIFQLFGSSSIDLTLHVWVDTTKVGVLAARDMAIAAIQQAFAAEAIEIPYPIQTVQLERYSN